MTVTMTRVLNLQSLYPRIKEQVLPIRTTYKLTKLFNAIDDEAKFYSSELNKIIDTYAEKDESGRPVPTEDGTGVKLQKDSVVEAQAKITELWNLEVELPDQKFSIDELEKIDLSIEEFNMLLPFIED